MISQNTVDLLLEKADFYNQYSFIEKDPVSIPHLFSKKQDIEIAGFFAAMFAWGNRTQIIKKSKELMNRLDNSPHDFILNAKDSDLKSLQSFKHRTFNGIDLLFFIDFFKEHFSQHDSLEDAFLLGNMPENNVKSNLINFYKTLSQKDYFPARTAKHIASPAKGSACKRLNMYLRWMVRQDKKGVDFGIWNRLKPSQLVIPVDLHVQRSISILKLAPPTKNINWKYAETITEILKELVPKDPCVLDFALFGMSIEGYFD